ncbi:MAG: amidase [Chloroflexota bacterium]|jgi:amidase|nr:amidase [Chloroflexota bacterium]
MAPAHDLTFTPAAELVRRMASREISPVELVDACLARIEALNPQVNAFILVLADEARAAARDSEARIARNEARPLEGLPIPIKDIALVAGTPATLGSRMSPDFPIPFDSESVARLRRAGAVIIGKTHMPELGSTVASVSERFGATRNPWNLEHSPGGSSSGAAAAVASGMVPVAHGADGGGSLRIPASWTGLFTIKPTRGRVSEEPLGDVTGLLIQGFITRTVMDNALLLDQVQGYARGDRYWCSPLERPFTEEVGADPGKLRIGWTLKPPYPTPVDPACAAAVERAVAILTDLGHDVEAHDPDWADEEAAEIFLNIWRAQFGYAVDALARFGLDPSLLEPHSHALWEQSKQITASDYLSAVGRSHDMLKRLDESFQKYDVILSPTTALPPPTVGWLFEDAATDPLSPLIPRSAMAAPFTALFNITGQPAASWPLGWTVDGLPVGVQAAGQMGDEATLFRLSAQVEQAAPWADRRPVL